MNRAKVSSRVPHGRNRGGTDNLLGPVPRADWVPFVASGVRVVVAIAGITGSVVVDVRAGFRTW
jgi:hypothetical protein